MLQPENDPAHDYRIAEYEALRNEVITRLERQITIEVYVIISCAVVYGFLAYNPEHGFTQYVSMFLWLVWWVPPALILFGFVRWQTNNIMIRWLSEYLSGQFDDHVKRLDGNHTGWNRFLQRKRQEERNESRRTVALWWVILLFTISAALWQSYVAVTSEPIGKPEQRERQPSAG